MSEFSWSDDSALWQIDHGEAGTARTLSARAYLDKRLADDERRDYLDDLMEGMREPWDT